MLLFYAVHYPHPEKGEQLIQRMHEFGKLIEKQPGIIFINPFRDPEKGTLIALAIWESQEAFQTSWPVLAKDAPPEELEVKPREVYVFPSAIKEDEIIAQPLNDPAVPFGSSQQV